MEMRWNKSEVSLSSPDTELILWPRLPRKDNVAELIGPRFSTATGWTMWLDEKSAYFAEVFIIIIIIIIIRQKLKVKINRKMTLLLKNNWMLYVITVSVSKKLVCQDIFLSMILQCFLESINAVSQSTSRYEDAHIAAFASFELGMLKAQSAQNATVSFTDLCSMFW